MGQLLEGPVRRISLLLMFIWFANALNYYGLVLLTTTVRPPPPLPPPCPADRQSASA